MFALIIENTVAALYSAEPIIGDKECALIVSCADDVQVGWSWTPEGCTDPAEIVLTEVSDTSQSEITNESEVVTDLIS
jgi:hypothetical protein